MRFRGSRGGQSLVETALVLPVIVFLVLMVADVGRAFYYREATTNAARQAIRVAVNSGQQAHGNAVCGATVGKVHAPQATFPPVVAGNLSDIATAAALESTSNGTVAGTRLSNASNPTTLDVWWHCNGGAITNAGAGSTHTAPSDNASASIQVTIKYTFRLITPFATALVGSQNMTVAATEYGRAEY